MRPHTLSAHLSIPEDSLRNERIQVADQLKLVRKLREEGRDESAPTYREDSDQAG